MLISNIILFIISIYCISKYYFIKREYKALNNNYIEVCRTANNLIDYKLQNNIFKIDNPDKKTNADDFYFKVILKNKIYYFTNESMTAAAERALKY